MKRRYFLIIPLCLHLAFATFIYLAGKWALRPDKLNESGLLLVNDNLEYHDELVSLVNKLRAEGFLVFARTPSSIQVKLYSISHYILSPLFGDTIMSAEPVNVLFYLAILCLLFRLGSLVCSREASLIAAGVVAVWPSFLLHTTQLFRDPLFISAMLALVLITLRWLTTDYSWRKALACGFAGAAAAVVLWMVRGSLKDVVTIMLVSGAALLLGKQIGEKRFLAANTVGAVIVIVAALIAPRFITSYHLPSSEAANTESRARDLGSLLPTKIARFRDKFLDGYADAGSNIDTGVRFNSVGDIARYLPRALAIGLFAPFPQMWFDEGKEVGTGGRLIAGVETFVMYLFELLAAFAFWKMRRRWEAWFLLLVVLIGVVSLALVVTNIGALYRMRYVYWMLLIPLGAEGAIWARAWWGERKRAAHRLT